MLTKEEKNIFLKIIPHKQICTSWGNLSDLIQQLDKISNHRFDMAFIQSECHSGMEVVSIRFEEKIQTLEVVNTEDLAIDEILLPINEWLHTSDLLPHNFCFDKVQFPDGVIGICFFDKFSKIQLIREGIADKLCFMGNNWSE